MEEVKNETGYQSLWKKQMDALLGQLQSRKAFSFDVGSDGLYQQYRDQYTRQGKLAMEDTMGQAAALTGGYGNSYAQSAGQQAYQGYLDGLNDKIPELYQLAQNRYNQEGSSLMQQFGLLSDQDNRDYSRYQDAAALAKSQVEAMLAIGVKPSEDLVKASGLSEEYIGSRLAAFSYGGGGGGGSSGGRSGGGGSSAGAGYGVGYGSALTLVRNGMTPASQESYIQDAYSKGLITTSGVKNLEKLVGNTAYSKR